MRIELSQIEEKKGNESFFITISTRGIQQYFGRCSQGKVVLSVSGYIAKKSWLEISLQFPGVVLDAFIIMPNHIHGILSLDAAPFDTEGNRLCEIINAYKMAVRCKTGYLKLENTVAWQKGFHHRKLRDEFERERLRAYIRDNPKKWRCD